MTTYLLWVFLLALWNTILFFAKDYGINVILFIIPLMGFMYYLLKKEKKIVNEKGLLYIIPIVLLSLTYLIYDNELFRILDFFAIPILISFMVIYTTDSTYNVLNIVQRVIEYLIVPYKYIVRLFRVTKTRLSHRLKMKDKTTKILKALVIVIPITIFIVALLSSADMVFGKIFGDFLDKLLEILKIEFLDKLIGRIVLLIIMFFVIGCATMYILYEKKEKLVEKTKSYNVDLLTSKILLCVLNVIYVVFDFIQIKSLVFHSVASNIDYASYARRGFFELLVVSLINLTIILITRRFENKDNKEEFNFVKIMHIVMVFLTIVIIASSFLRMHMYEVEYGYTVLRLLVFAALITEAVLMIPTVMYIFNRDFNIVKSYMLITLVAFLCCNFINMDYVIARRNVNRYYYANDIDLDYLKNYRYDNIPVLIELYNKTSDFKIKNSLGRYLDTRRMDADNIEHGIFEFNISHYRARALLDKTDFSRIEYDTDIDYKDYYID